MATAKATREKQATLTPGEHLEQLLANRYPPFNAAWEATRGHLRPADVQEQTGGRISASTLNGWLRGEFVPTLQAADELARVLGRPNLTTWLGEGLAYLEQLRATVARIDSEKAQRDAEEEVLELARKDGALAAIGKLLAEMPAADREETLQRLMGTCES